MNSNESRHSADNIQSFNIEENKEVNNRIYSNTFANKVRQSAKRLSNFYDNKNSMYFKMTDIKEEADDNSMRSGIALEENENKRELLSFTATLFTFIKVNLVAGFLFLPGGFKVGGWIFSTFCVIIISSIITYCNISLAACSDVANTFTLSSVGERALGKFGKYITEIGIAIAQILYPCSYVFLTATQLDNIIHNWFNLPVDTHYYWYFAIALLFVLIPMVLVRDISYFSKLHLIGDIAVLATVLTLAITSISSLVNGTAKGTTMVTITPYWAKTMGMSVSMLEGVGLILPIKESMKDKKDFPKVVLIGMTVVITILIGFPLLAYFCFKDQTKDIILGNLDQSQLYIQIIVLLLIFSILVVYPVVLSPSFKILEANFITCINRKYMWQNILRCSIVLFTVIMGIISIGKFENVIALAGSAISTPIALIFPTIFHFKLYKDKQSIFRSCLDICITLFGIGLSITIFTFTIINWNVKT